MNDIKTKAALDPDTPDFYPDARCTVCGKPTATVVELDKVVAEVDCDGEGRWSWHYLHVSCAADAAVMAAQNELSHLPIIKVALLAAASRKDLPR